MKSISSRKKIVAISAAIAVPLAVLLGLIAMPGTTTYKSTQLGDTSLESQVESAEKIFTGQVVNVDIKQVDQFIEIPDDPDASFWRHDLYQFVTVKTTEFLKDETGDNPEQVTFYDDVTGCFDYLEKQCQVAEFAIEYELGENALFIVERVEDPADGPLDGLLTTLGYVETYKIAGDKAQSSFEKAADKEARKLADLENEIMEKQGKEDSTA